MNRLRKIGTFLADRVNPIAVKELRQAVQSRLVISILLLFLAVNVAIVSGFLMLHENVATDQTAGQNLFMILFGVLVMTCMFFVPLYAGIRLTIERNDANIDLLFITTISPGAIIRGKFWAAVALTVLIFSTVMPFLTFTYLLRGIDLPSVFFALAMALTFISFMTMLAIFAGSISAGWLVRILMGLFLLGTLYSAVMGTMFYGYEIVSRGVAAQFFGRETWAAFGLATLLLLSVLGLMYLLSVACISAKSSNRMFPIRLFLTGVWLVFGVALGIWSSVDSTYDPLIIWTVFSVCAFSAFLLFIPAERENWTPRVRRRIPRYTLPRFIAWLLYTGSAGGVLWCAAIVGTTLLVAWLALELPLNTNNRYRSGSLDECLTWLPAIFLFAWCYSLSGLLVRRTVAPKSPTVVTPIISISLLTAGCTLPILVAYLTLGSYWQMNSLPIAYVLVNPFAMLSRYNSSGDRDLSYVFLIAWAVVVFLVNVLWFYQQWEAFRRHEPKAAAAPILATLVEEPAPQPLETPLLLVEEPPPASA